jgi:hypothetical protein
VAKQEQANEVSADKTAGSRKPDAGLQNNQMRQNCNDHGGVRSMNKYMVLQKREREEEENLDSSSINESL